jgi:hypothetical protein
VESTAEPAKATAPVTTKMYLEALNKFDVAVCDAVAVSQATCGRQSAAHVRYATHVFTRLCAYAVALIRAAPRSRWVRSDSDNWDFGSVAGYCRAIFEGQLLFWYLIKPPVSDEELSARINVMHLNDCSRRITILGTGSTDLAGFESQQAEIRGRLEKNNWFLALDSKWQKRLLTGDVLTITSRDELLDQVGWDRKHFYAYWHLLSQYTHVLPLTFYRLEPNGRGTGIENDTDRGYIYLMLDLAAQALRQCVDKMVENFPDAALVRKGINSRFSPGPIRNRPKREPPKGGVRH